MRGRVFVDSNIFVYLQSTDDEAKRAVSKRVIDEFDCVISTQSLNEVSNVLARKARMPYDHVAQIIEGMTRVCELLVVSYETIRNALEIAKNNTLGYYDSLIIAAASEAECPILISEDMNDGQLVGSVKIVNIYKHPELF